MLPIITAILPVFLLIFLGTALRRQGFPGEGFWTPAERLSYVLLFPALIVETLATAELGGLRVLPMAVALMATLLAVAALLMTMRPLLRVDGPGLTSLIQGATRMNGFICLAVAASLWGSAGLTLAAIAIAVIVPTVNVTGVMALAHYGSMRQPGVRGILASLARNPLIVAVVLGIALNGTGIGMPPVIAPLAEIMGNAALPIGLLSVGAALDLGAARRQAPVIAQNAALKLLGVPALGAAVLWAFGVEGITAGVAVLFLASPTAVSGYILARQHGGDAPLMAGIVTAQTTASLVTLPVVLAVFA
jgi:predicted permease